MPVGQHARVAREEFTDQWNQEVAAEGVAHADLERARRIFVDAADAGHGSLQRRQRALDVAQETLAGFGQCQPTGAALEQAYAEIALEACHVLADAGRRQAEDARRGGKAAVFGGPDERDQKLNIRHDRS